MTDLLKELLGFYKEKTKLPIVSTYVILLIVWNWDILSIYLFSSVNMETRICWIKNIVTGFWDHFFRVLWPIAISFAYPFIAEPLMYVTDRGLKSVRYWRKEFKRKEDILSAKAKYLIAAEESGKRDIEEMQEQLNNANEQRDKLIQSLKETQDFYKTEIENLQDKTIGRFDSNSTSRKVKPGFSFDDYSEFAALYIKYSRNNSKDQRFMNILSAFKTGLLLSEEMLEFIGNRIVDLALDGLVKRVENEEGKVSYQITQKAETLSDYIYQFINVAK